ncbi:OLC1v1020551C1 [Oldenlandia corymbosa var. corymbosa]|uniref:OLC1v1020551C1 n=1 Tax=Oldenlandia corymbosa var. corymbosa TaxID=529605 RepID=A0AAV1EGV4_OLDCO|nr:OLC1v1020551C1 [Oldenlandia corymbosa var. corymbosa]
MAVPDAAVSFLLENVSQILTYNYHLIADVKENIEKLEGNLKLLKSAMVDFSKYNDDMEYVKQIIKDIKSILWEAEDAIDNYLAQAAIQKFRKGVIKFYHQFTDYPKVLRDIGKCIEEIGERVEKITADRVRDGIEALNFGAINNLNRTAKSAEGSRVEEDQVIIGFDGAAEKVEELLVKGPETLEIVSIVGMLGLGKTTLAKMVFKDPDVDYEFMTRVFVYVSEEYQKKEVLLKILGSFTKINDEVSGMDEVRLENHLRQQLEGKSYLIVLDDVWEPTHWDDFKFAFPKNNKRCRVLITTRREDVARHANPTNPDSVYKLDFLNFEHSRELLRWRVFYKNECPPALEEYEIKIVEKCDGLPLALVVIAGILVNHPDRTDWWRHVSNSVRDYIAKDATQATKVIDLMYKHLPNHLKTCFLYLGVFREDFEIPVWKLVRLWISEGLIPQEGDLDLEITAEQYLDELVYRNVVMVGQRRSNDKIKTCRMHDTLREFCKKEATEENLFQEIKTDNLDMKLDQCRRICINNVQISNFLSPTTSGKSVRSFLTCPKEDMAADLKLVSNISKAFKLLRVLEIPSLISPRFSPDLCGLVLLKYIAIQIIGGIIPAVFSQLLNLQTLIVKTSSPTLEIKADIWKLSQFRHLHTNASASFPPPSSSDKTKGKEGAPPLPKNVQTLCTISPESCNREVFAQTPKLKKLGICGSLSKLFQASSKANLFEYLRTLEYLENLKLLNDDDMSSKLYSLPPKKSFPPHLTRLTLSHTFLGWDEMSVIGELDELEVLKLKEFAFQGTKWEPNKGGFKSLKHLFIGRTDLVVWQASVDHFPKLKSLELNGCDKLQSFPHGLADIPSLQSVVLHCTNTNVANSARKLQVLKLKQANKGNKSTNFKLSVYPPEH